LNKWNDLAGFSLVEVYEQNCPFCLPQVPQAGVFSKIDQLTGHMYEIWGQIDEGLERKVIQQKPGLSILKPLTLISLPDTGPGN